MDHNERVQWIRDKSAERGTPCILCDGAGEIWQSGYMVPCICDNVTTALARTKEQLREVTEERDTLRAWLLMVTPATGERNT